MGARPLAPRDDFDLKVAAMIRCKAAQLARGGGFAPGDREDLEQELALHVTAKGCLFDPARASATTFADRILARKVVDLARAANAAKRGRLKQRRLDAVPEGTLLEGEDAADSLDLKIDVREAVALLPEDLRRLAERLTTWGVAKVARLTGMSRQQVRTAVKKIEGHLRERGLDPDSENILKHVTIPPKRCVNIYSEEAVSA